MALKARAAGTSRRERDGILSAWMQAFRIHYIPTSIFPAVLGSVIAWATGETFHPWYFVLVVIGVSINHMGLNMIDDVFDYRHAVDQSRGGEKNPYTGGSGVLTEELLPVGYVFAASILCFIVTGIIALYLTVAVGWAILVFAAIGVASSVLYTMPPVKYGYRGFGELGLLINFGPVICLGAYYVQTTSLGREPFIISLVPGFLMWSMIVINEIPDYEEDRNAGKMNLVARFGRVAGIGLYAAGLIGAYGTIIIAAWTRATSPGVLLGLLSVPVAVSAFRVLMKNYMNRLAMAPANLATIKVHFLTLMCLIMGYLGTGFLR
ncbi:MAG: prenyltransferase [Deltaproteobacteria bacterium]|nr:prenyltransferase [Deltaproteobacteria bacterium]MBN2688820.1 prenyltransferase [Deltaproteobacteria bacterium]